MAHACLFFLYLFILGPLVHEEPKRILLKDHKSNKLLVPTPLVLANGNAILLKKTNPKPAALVNTPKTTALNSHLPPASPTTAAGTAISPPNPGGPGVNAHPSSELMDLPPSFIPEPPVRTNSINGAVVKDNPPTSNLDRGSDQKHKSVTPDMPVMLLPPPTDFMDDPGLLTTINTPAEGQNQPPTSNTLSPQPAVQFPSQPCPSESMPIAPPPGFDGNIEPNKLSPNELDKLRKKASMKKAPAIVPVVQVKPSHNVSDQANSPSPAPDTSAATVADYGEPKSPPIVAPKPKKLPSSIVLKNHKDATPSHSLVSPGDRMIINQQKVHQEALKKLGLLKTDESGSGFSHSPPHKASPPASLNTNTSVASPAERTADSLAVRAEHQAVVEAHGNVHTHPDKGENPLTTRAPSPKPFEMKSASMERSGIGLKSLTLENPSQSPSQEESPESTPVRFGHLRNSRSQPASKGSLKDLSINQTPSESRREPELRRSLPIPIPKVEPHRSLRPHGVSVVISPQSKNGEDRKQALRRLGLGQIKD